MKQQRPLPATPADHHDLDLVRAALARAPDAFRTIMRANNRRLYRVARSILRNDSDAEDAVQEAYCRAFERLGSFRGEASLSTWLTRIVLNEALGRLRARRPEAPPPQGDGRMAAEIIPFPTAQRVDDPERSMAQREILHLVERATDQLPDEFRVVFVARAIEGMSVEETAALLGLKPETVKTRLHRARRLLRAQLDRQIGPLLLDAFPFAGRRCERLTSAVLRHLGWPE